MTSCKDEVYHKSTIFNKITASYEYSTRDLNENRLPVLHNTPIHRPIKPTRNSNNVERMPLGMRGLSQRMTAVCEDTNKRLEGLVREKNMLLGDTEDYKRYSLKVLEQMQQMNIKLHEALTDIVKGEKEFNLILRETHRDGKVKNSKAAEEIDDLLQQIQNKDQIISALTADKKVVCIV